MCRGVRSAALAGRRPVTASGQRHAANIARCHHMSVIRVRAEAGPRGVTGECCNLLTPGRWFGGMAGEVRYGERTLSGARPLPGVDLVRDQPIMSGVQRLGGLTSRGRARRVVNFSRRVNGQ